MSWQIRHFNEVSYANSRASIPCLLIPGWGVGGDIFDSILPGLAQFFQVYIADYSDLPETLEQGVSELAASLPFNKPAVVIGWSLGGNIAIELAKSFSDKVASLCLIATNPSFVARSDWPHAMAESTYVQFQNGVKLNPAKTLRRFDALQSKGDDQEQALQKALTDYRAQQKAWSDEDLNTGLNWLAAVDQRECLAQLCQPQLWCFGSEDQLVPVTCSDAVKALVPDAVVQRMERVAHLPFLSRSDQFFTALLDALYHNPRDHKRKIANAFSQAAGAYDDAARIQRWAAEYLLQKVPIAPEQFFIDAGCGTGRHTAQLAAKTHVVGLDIAEGMLKHAKDKYTGLSWLAADAEHLPFETNSVDGIYSSLSVQWSQQPQALLTEWRRVLKPGGRIYLATLGNKTLQELRASFAAIDNEPHVNRFATAGQWQHCAELAGLQVEQAEVISRNDYYPDLSSLLRSLKDIGAQTVLYRKAGGMMGKKRWQALQAAYESFRDEHGLPASYQLIFLCLQKSDE